MTASREDFGRLAMDFLRAQGEARPITFDVERFRLVVGEGGGPFSFAYLGHAYGEYLSAPEIADKVLISRLWTVVRRVGEVSREVLLRAVVPRVRDRAWFSALRRQAELELGADEEAIDEVMLPHEDLNDELAVHLAYELPTSVMELGGDRLTAWSTSFEDLHVKALENLRARSTREFENPEPGVYVSPYHDSLDATRIVLTELFEKLPLKGKPVVVAPTHDILLVTGDEDAAGLMSVATWAEEALLEPRAHSAVAFRLEEGKWRPWLPPPGHQAYTKFRLLALQTLASVYARQKEVLEALLEANGHDIFVANMRAFRAPTGAIFTSAAWTEGVEALLPRTDRLEFVRMPPGGGEAGSARVWSTSWDVARRVVGDMMEETGDVPARWLVKGFPSNEQLEKMADEGKVPT